MLRDLTVNKFVYKFQVETKVKLFSVNVFCPFLLIMYNLWIFLSWTVKKISPKQWFPIIQPFSTLSPLYFYIMCIVYSFLNIFASQYTTLFIYKKWSVSETLA